MDFLIEQGASKEGKKYLRNEKSITAFEVPCNNTAPRITDLYPDDRYFLAGLFRFPGFLLYLFYPCIPSCRYTHYDTRSLDPVATIGANPSALYTLPRPPCASLQHVA